MTRHPPTVVTAAVFDTKPDDREALQKASENPWYRVALS
jgi:hypothetical protein